jgi:hypothetical protein
MTRALCAVALTAMLVPLALTQDMSVSPPLTARENHQAVSTEPGTAQVAATHSSHLSFCPPKTCLYYAGDFNSADSNANGLYNTDNVTVGVGLTWVGVKPARAATVTGVTFNQFFTSGFTGTNPTPFQTQIGIVEGSGGTIVCTTSGNATMKRYGESDFGLVQYSYTVKKLAKPCKIQAGSKGATYVNLLPTSSNGYGYVVNVEDAKPKNHRGWRNDLNDCYFYDPNPYAIYIPCNSQGLGTNGFSELSIALTGKEKK